MSERMTIVSERMIIDALPVRDNLLLALALADTGSPFGDEILRASVRECIKKLEDAPRLETAEWRQASEIPVGRNDEWNWAFIVGKDAKKAYTTTAAAQYDAKEDCWVTDLLTEFKKVDGHYLTKDLGYEVTHWMPQPEPPERRENA